MHLHVIIKWNRLKHNNRTQSPGSRLLHIVCILHRSGFCPSSKLFIMRAGCDWVLKGPHFFKRYRGRAEAPRHWLHFKLRSSFRMRVVVSLQSLFAWVTVAITTVQLSHFHLFPNTSLNIRRKSQRATLHRWPHRVKIPLLSVDFIPVISQYKTKECNRKSTSQFYYKVKKRCSV